MIFDRKEAFGYQRQRMKKLPKSGFHWKTFLGLVSSQVLLNPKGKRGNR